LTQPTIVHVGIDESGSLYAPTQFFVLAAVLTENPEPTKNLIRRTAFHSGKHLGRFAKNPSELKWYTASERIKQDVLERIAESDLEIFGLVVQKEGRRIEDTPENSAYLLCELLDLIWYEHPKLNVLVDRHFTAPSQIATMNTILYRHLPTSSEMALAHVDSQYDSLVQLADFVAGSLSEFHKRQDAGFRLIENKIKTTTKTWAQIKAEWLARGK